MNWENAAFLRLFCFYSVYLVVLVSTNNCIVIV